MAYADGNSVLLTPDYGFNIASPTGIPSGGYPFTAAIAFKPTEDTQATDSLVGISLATGNHWLRFRANTTLSGPTTQSGVTMSARAGAGGTEVTRGSAAAITQDIWSIIVVKFIDADTWALVIDDNALESFTSVGGPTPVGINTLYYANNRGIDYLDGVTAWAAVWFSALADAAMQSIAAGNTPPSDHAPDELIYFEGTTAIEGQNGSTVNQTGAGSIAEDVTDPTGWPPAGDATTILPLINAYYG